MCKAVVAPSHQDRPFFEVNPATSLREALPSGGGHPFAVAAHDPWGRPVDGAQQNVFVGPHEPPPWSAVQQTVPAPVQNEAPPVDCPASRQHAVVQHLAVLNVHVTAEDGHFFLFFFFLAATGTVAPPLMAMPVIAPKIARIAARREPSPIVMVLTRASNRRTSMMSPLGHRPSGQS